MQRLRIVRGRRVDELAHRPPHAGRNGERAQPRACAAGTGASQGRRHRAGPGVECVVRETRPDETGEQHFARATERRVSGAGGESREGEDGRDDRVRGKWGGHAGNLERACLDRQRRGSVRCSVFFGGLHSGHMAHLARSVLRMDDEAEDPDTLGMYLRNNGFRDEETSRASDAAGWARGRMFDLVRPLPGR